MTTTDQVLNNRRITLSKGSTALFEHYKFSWSEYYENKTDRCSKKNGQSGRKSVITGIWENEDNLENNSLVKVDKYANRISKEHSGALQTRRASL
jgi:hypothetical protein